MRTTKERMGSKERVSGAGTEKGRAGAVLIDYGLPSACCRGCSSSVAERLVEPFAGAGGRQAQGDRKDLAHALVRRNGLAATAETVVTPHQPLVERFDRRIRVDAAQVGGDGAGVVAVAFQGFGMPRQGVDEAAAQAFACGDGPGLAFVFR